MLDYFQARQGDVLIEEVNEIPSDAKEVGRDEFDRIVLAYGEVTGHAHAIKNKQVKHYVSNDAVYLDVVEKSKVTHEEHKEIPLDSKKYRVIRQTEFFGLTPKFVAD